MKIISILFLFCIASAGPFTAGDTQQFEFSNAIKNGGCEGGLGWANSGGTYARTATAGNVGEGYYSCSFNASATTQYLQSELSSVLKHGNCEAKLLLKGWDTNVAVQVLNSNGDILASRTLIAYTNFQKLSINFICNADAAYNTYRVKFLSSADAAIGYVDAVYIGKATNIGTVAQSNFFGSIEWAPTTNCIWDNTDTSAPSSDFPADEQCDDNPITYKGSAVADASTPGRLPQIRLLNGDSGHYVINLYGAITESRASSTGADAFFNMDDGTTDSTIVKMTNGGASGNIWLTIPSMSFSYDFTSGFSDKTIKLQAYSDKHAYVYANVAGFKIEVLYFPSAESIVSSNEKNVEYWSGYTTTTDCAGFTRNNSAYGSFAVDNDCTLNQHLSKNMSVTVYNSGGILPGIQLIPSKAGNLYEVCVGTSMTGGTSGQNIELQLVDGSTQIAATPSILTANDRPFSPVNLCGFSYASSLAQKTFELQGRGDSTTIYLLTNRTPIWWTVKNITNGYPQIDLQNMVTTPASSGVRIVSALLNCDAGSAITQQDDSWVSSIGNRSGSCAVTVAAGIFSVIPVCAISRTLTSGGTFCIPQSGATSVTNINIDCTTLAVAQSDFDSNLICIGAK